MHHVMWLTSSTETKRKTEKKEGKDEFMPGTEISGWRVKEKLGQGTYGAVYQVDKENEKEPRALKIALNKIRKNQDEFCMEKAALRIGTEEEFQHMPKLLDEGIYKERSFFVMEKVGTGLENYTLNLSTRDDPTRNQIRALRIGMQTLIAIYDLHRVGLLHRDLKVENMSLDDDHRTYVHLLDYNSARFFIQPDGKLRLPRSRGKRNGTKLFMSFLCEMKRDCGRVDDLWSWFYVLCEIMNGSLAWDQTQRNFYYYKMFQKIKTGTKKAEKKDERKFYYDLKTPELPARYLINGGPEELHSVKFHLECLNFESCPDYYWLFSTLDKALTRLGADPKDILYPFDDNQNYDDVERDSE